MATTKITKEMSILEVLRRYPWAQEIFLRHGMGCAACMGAVGDTIEEGAKSHGLNLEKLLADLNRLEPQEHLHAIPGGNSRR